MCVDNKRNYFIKVEKKKWWFPKTGKIVVGMEIETG